LHLASLDDISALGDLSLPELFDGIELLILGVLQVGRHLIQEESAVGLVTIGHVLLAVVVPEVLELEVGDGAGGKV
jgi:hypothetical protein